MIDYTVAGDGALPFTIALYASPDGAIAHKTNATTSDQTESLLMEFFCNPRSRR